MEVLAHPLSATLFSEKDAAGKLDTLKNVRSTDRIFYHCD